MTWLQFTSDMVGHLAWPLVVLIIAFAVRKHLGSLAERILELSFGGATVKFDKLLSKGAQIIGQTFEIEEIKITSASKHDQPEISEAELNARLKRNLDRLTELRSQPADVPTLLRQFEEVQETLRQIGGALGMNKPAWPLRVMNTLIAKDIVSPDFGSLYEGLRDGRNIVAHGQATLTPDEIGEYVRQASYFLVQLEMLLESIQKGWVKPA